MAWHPEVSGLLCIGGSEDASLSLWNINTYAMIDYLPAKFEGRVENLAWNKLSGELVVHWSYPVGNNRHSVMPVLANFERTVDAIPLDKDERLSFLKFNTTQKQLSMYRQRSGLCSHSDCTFCYSDILLRRVFDMEFFRRRETAGRTMPASLQHRKTRNRRS